MKGYVLQLTKNVVDEGDKLDYCTLVQGEYDDEIEWCSNVDDPKEIQEAIETFIKNANKLKEGMFTQVDGGVRYNGGADIYLNNLIEAIREEANKLTPKRIEIGLEKICNAMRSYTDTLVYPYEDKCESYADDMGYYLRNKAIKLKKGDILHVGGVIKYHHSKNNG